MILVQIGKDHTSSGTYENNSTIWSASVLFSIRKPKNWVCIVALLQFVVIGGYFRYVSHPHQS